MWLGATLATYVDDDVVAYVYDDVAGYVYDDVSTHMDDDMAVSAHLINGPIVELDH
jgi:hypothetical protein